ncbi:MAG: AAA family ATPase [Chloroflexi bacterium]|nr:AAA family ATPase [Chloroflexota bacterium]
MPTLRIWLFGDLRFSYGDTPVTSAYSARRQALLAFLLLHRDVPLARQQLAFTLFPDAPEPVARRALTDALYRLRRDLGAAAAWVQPDAELVRIVHECLWVDVEEFCHCASSPRSADWQRALDLYSGDLLQYLDAEWLLAPRARLREQFLVTHERLYRALMADCRWADALACAHRWTLADPLCEEAHRAAMQLCARLGRPAAALEQYDRLTRTLNDELNVLPLPETRAMAAAIRHEYDTAADKSIKPFVGRRRERAQLIQQADHAQAGRGGIMLVEGEPGIGKTRLLEEFAQGAQWRGLTVVWGRARQLSATRPCSPVDQALSNALTGPRADQVRARVEPPVAQAAAYLAPRLQTDAAMPLTDSPPDLPLAAAAILRALAQITPHVLLSF